MYFSKTIKDEIKDLIIEVENKTECEIVPMLITTSHRYHYAHYFVGIIFSIFATIALYLSPFYFVNPVYYILIQIVFFIVGFSLAYIERIKRFFISKKDFEYEVNLKSYEAFFNHNLHLTKNHNGVLIFISMFERKIKILCDKTVKEAIDSKIWDEIIQEFAQSCKKEDILNALKITINHVGNVLENKFPRNSPKTENHNELKNNLIIELK